MSTEEIAATLTTLAEAVSIGRYCTLAAWVLLLYDHIIHLDKEIELFWMKPWSFAKGLYLFNRYSAAVFIGIHAMIFLSPNVTDGICLGWFKFEGYTGTIGIAAVELILGFRVLALWNRNKIITFIVYFALFCEISAMLGILTSTYVHMGAVSTPIPGIPYKACLPFNIPPYFFAFWLPPLGYESLVFLLAAAKGYQTLHTAFVATRNAARINIPMPRFSISGERRSETIGRGSSTVASAHNHGAVEAVAGNERGGNGGIIGREAEARIKRTTFFAFKTTGSRLLEVMIRDSLWYFLLIFVCDMICSLIWLKGPDSLLQAVVGFGLVIPSVAGSHLLLNLRDAYYHPTGITTASTGTRTYDLPTFNRSVDNSAKNGKGPKKRDWFTRSVAGGRQLDTEWALDPEQDKVTHFSTSDPDLKQPANFEDGDMRLEPVARVKDSSVGGENIELVNVSKSHSTTANTSHSPIAPDAVPQPSDSSPTKGHLPRLSLAIGSSNAKSQPRSPPTSSHGRGSKSPSSPSATSARGIHITTTTTTVEDLPPLFAPHDSSKYISRRNSVQAKSSVSPPTTPINALSTNGYPSTTPPGIHGSSPILDASTPPLSSAPLPREFGTYGFGSNASRPGTANSRPGTAGARDKPMD